MHDSADIEAMIEQLKGAPTADHRTALIRPLNLALIGLSLIGLVLMLIPPITSVWYYYLLVGGSIGMNVLVWQLTRVGRTGLASRLFCAWIAVGILALAVINLYGDTPVGAAIFASVLALPVMLAGMLLSNRYAFGIALLGSGTFGLVTALYYLGRPSADGSHINEAISIIFPVFVFLLMIALISWLYQRALAAAAARLQVARQRILRDELLRRDLAIARELQQRLYPPPPLTNANLRIASRSEPARETSGDFYDFIDLGEGRLGIVVADVTGKSLAAALVMAMARGTLRSEATRHTSPADVLSFANQTLCQDRSVKQMITTFYGVLDTNELTLRFANAGHPYPFIKRNGQLQEIELGGLPLSAHPAATYGEQTVQLQPGDQVFLISDGLLEEHNAGREIFGFERLNMAISAASADDPDRALAQIWQSVAAFRGATEQSDDITLVVIQVAETVAVPELIGRCEGTQPAASLR